MKTCRVKALMMVAMGIALFLCAGNVQAIMAIPNWTLTTYNVGNGSLDFTWDLDSIYDLSTGVGVDLKENTIYSPGSGSLIGTIYEFVIPNFYDPLPMKTIEVTMVGSNEGAVGLQLATVLDIIGADSPYGGSGGPASPVDGMFISDTILVGHVTELWHMFPNPDFEIVKIYAPVEFELQSITIETQSVPIPPAVWMFGSGLVVIAGLRRRKFTN